MFSSVIHKTWKQSTVQQGFSEQRKVLDVSIQMECYSTVEVNEALVLATTWINKNTALSEQSQKERPHTVTFRLHEMSRKGKSVDTGSRFELPQAESRNKDELEAKSYWGDRNVQKTF